MTEVPRDEAISAIRAFIGADPQQGREAWFVSLDEQGNPSLRQISTFIEGWTVWTVSQSKSLKVKHLRADPRTSYLWVEDQPVRRRKNVWMRGTAKIVEDQDDVAAFMERRSQALNFRVPERDWHRVVVRFEPEYLRAESFLCADAGNTPVILRTADFAAAND